MPRKSCLFPCKFLLAAAALCLGTLPPPAGAQEGVIRLGNPELQAQRRLPQQSGRRALLFIGGFGDEVSGIMSHLAGSMPALDPERPELRAYYWYSGGAADPAEAPARLEKDIRAFLRLNPGADIILIAHSMGAGTALRTLARFSAAEGRFYLLTLDPVDGSLTPQRPPCVRWWGNAYVTHSRSPRDFIAEMGGRWNACKGADYNLRFDGRRPEARGFYPIHDDAAGQLLGRPGGRVSLMESLREALR